MNFVPSIPQMSQQNQGVGYGDWQQYAGYNKDNTFGGSGGLNVGVKPPSTKKSTGSPAPVTDLSSDKPSTQVGYDYSIAPTANSTMGASSLNTMGASLNPTNIVSSDIFSAFGVME